MKVILPHTTISRRELIIYFVLEKAENITHFNKTSYQKLRVEVYNNLRQTTRKFNLNQKKHTLLTKFQSCYTETDLEEGNRVLVCGLEENLDFGSQLSNSLPICLWVISFPISA